MGNSWQADNGSEPGHDLFALVITNPDSTFPKAPMVLMAAQHARELATAEIATRFAERLVQNPDGDPDIEWLLDHRRIHVIAQQNPDGRRQVELGDAWWRKNHNATHCPSTNPGVDLNRNSSFLFGPPSSSGDPCSDVFRGPVEVSEPETQAIEAYLAQVLPDHRPIEDLGTPVPDNADGLFVSLHSFGELVLIPWEGLGGQNENNVPNHDALTILGRRMAWHTDYEVSRWFSLGPANGTAVDYAYGRLGVAAYTFEVGTTFQQSCSSFENTVWPDNRDALLLAAKAARRPYLEPAGPAVDALRADLVDGRVAVSGWADDTRYFRGGSPEPPAADPVADVVELRVSLGAPPDAAATVEVIPLPAMGQAALRGFDVMLPDGIVPPANGRVFVQAVDAEGRAGLPTMARLPLFQDGFES
ncbi:MAG: M14 family zinc carboxypeptidase [Wenzhouxiangellaceae bacterium]|nr:M14 family zinc carboxypeptidase [Wenzhouxiangellaceae bacterium]